MKKKNGLYLFLGAHVVLILLYIYQESMFIRISYQQQKLYKQKLELSHTLTNLTHEFQALKKRSAIKQYAQNTLKLKSMPLSALRQISHAH